MKTYVIARSSEAGLFFGELKEKQGKEVTLTNARKLYYWDGAAAPEQIAVDGIQPGCEGDCKFTVWVDKIIITEVSQILPCTDKSVESIKSIKAWKR